MSDQINRRHFIAGAGSASVGLFTARSMGQVLGANERIRLGIIGSGGRGRSLMQSFNKFPNVEFVIARAQWYWNQPPIPRKLELQGKLDWERFQAPAKHHRPVDAVRFRYFRNFWDYAGGHMTDQGTHLMDVIQWFCNDSKPPRAAV